MLRLSVAAGPGGGAGEVALIVPDGLAAEVDGAPAGTALTYRLDGGEYATWDVTVRTLPQTPSGRYFVAARISDELGQRIEDTALVTIGAPPPRLPTGTRWRRSSWCPRTSRPWRARRPWRSRPRHCRWHQGQPLLEVRVSNQLASELRGEVQVLPTCTWGAVPGSVAPVRADAGSTVTLSFPVTVPATAPPGWESWLVAKLTYFGRVRYSEAIRFTVTP